MQRVEVRTQAELDEAIKRKDVLPVLLGSEWFRVGGSAHVVARESAHVVAWESAHVVARESAHVVARESAHVEAWESARVEAWGSAHVVARGSAHVVARESAHVVARESAHVEARESAHVEASRWSSVRKATGHCGVIRGGIVIDPPPPTTAEEWCEFHGVAVAGGVATVYKALDDNFVSPRNGKYAPGSRPEAEDWDGGSAECGGGLHFSPHPLMALDFNGAATRFVACPVSLADMRPPRNGDKYPQKIKARRVCGPVVEVDRHGKPVAEAKAAGGRADEEAAG